MIDVIFPCLCNYVSGMSGVIYAIFSCLCNEASGMSGVFYIIARVYVMKFEICQE